MRHKPHRAFVPAPGRMAGHVESGTAPHNRIQKRGGHAARAACCHTCKMSALLVRVLARRPSGLAGAPGLAGAAASAGLILWHVANTHNAVLNVRKFPPKRPKTDLPPARRAKTTIACLRPLVWHNRPCYSAIHRTAILGSRRRAVQNRNGRAPHGCRLCAPVSRICGSAGTPAYIQKRLVQRTGRMTHGGFDAIRMHIICPPRSDARLARRPGLPPGFGRAASGARPPRIFRM